MIASSQAQAEHERRIIGDFLAFLRGQGREVGEPTFNPGKPDADAHVVIDGIFTAVELGCGYYERPDETVADVA